MMLAGGGLNHWADIVVVVVYFVLVLAVGLWTLCRPNRGSAQSYFLAGRDITWLPVGASLFASNIGSEHFVGLAGTGAASGIAIVVYEWMSMPLVMLLAWIFLPVYIAAGVFTLPEYLEKRFGGKRLRIYISCLSLVLYVVTKIAVSMYAGALFINMAIGWDIYLSVVALLAITAIFTVLGGLAAVIYTDTFQTVVMTIGAIILTIMGFQKVGGYESLEYLYMRAVPANITTTSTCGWPRDDAFHIFRHPVHADNPWPGLFLQASVGCMWYWCVDQVIVQRGLAAKNLSHAKGGAIVAGYLKLLPLFLMIFPGMISRVLYPDEVGCIDPETCEQACGNPTGCSNIAYPTLVLRLLPVGLRGLLMAVMLSAIMSSLTSIFNSASTLFAMDIWTKIRPRAAEKELLIVGRVCILVLCGISILWLPLVQSSAGGQLFVYIQAVQGYLGTPVGALFLFAIFWKRMNEKGALAGIMAGHVCGVIRLVLDFVSPEPLCGEEDTRPSVVADVHYTYMGQLIFVVTSLVIVVVSLMTKSDERDLSGVTWVTRFTNGDKDEVVEKIDLRVQTVDQKHTNGDVQAADQNGDMEKQTDTNVEITVKSKSFWQKCRVFLFGNPIAKTESSRSESWEDRVHRLAENPKWRTVLNANAVFALLITAFMIGWYR